MKLITTILLALAMSISVKAAPLIDTSPLEDLPQMELVPGVTPEHPDLGLGLRGLWKSALRTLSERIQEPIGFGVRILAVCLLLLLMVSLSKSGGVHMPDNAADLAGICAILMLALGESQTVLQEAVGAIGELVQFGNILFPLYAGAVAVAGHPVTASAQAGATILLANLIMRFASGLFIPVVKGYILLHAAAALADNAFLRNCASFAKSASVIAVRVLLLGFTAYLALSGIISGGADATAVKVARLAVTSAVPVVGAIVADASEAMLSGAALLKNSIGLFGCIAACAICMVPFIGTLLHYLVYRVLAAVSESFAGARCAATLRAVSDAFGFALGLLGTCCALQFLSFVVSTVVVT